VKILNGAHAPTGLTEHCSIEHRDVDQNVGDKSGAKAARLARIPAHVQMSQTERLSLCNSRRVGRGLAVSKFDFIVAGYLSP